MIYHLTRATRHFIFWLLIVGALFFTGLRVFLSEIAAYKVDLESKAGEIFAAPVTIGNLSATIAGFSPKLLLRDIDVMQFDGNDPAIQLREIRIGVNLFSLLTGWDLLAASEVTLVGTKLAVKRKLDGSISIVGLKASDDQPLWLLQGGRFQFLDSDVIWQDEKRHAKKLHFSHVDFFINNDLGNDQHLVNITMHLPETIGDSLRLSMRFSGDIFQPGNVNAKLYASGKNIQLTEMASGDLPLGVTIDQGAVNFKLWSRWKNSSMESLAGQIQALHTHVIFKNNKVLQAEKIAGLFLLRRHNGNWQLDVKRFTLQSAENEWPDAKFSIWSAESEPASAYQFAANIVTLDIAEAVQLLQLSGQLNKQQEAQLTKLAPNGRVENLAMFVDTANQQIAVNGFVEGFSSSALESIPQLNNISAYFHGTAQAGYLHLNSSAARVTFAKIFRAPIDIRQLAGTLSWQQTDENWLLSSLMLQLDTADIETRNKFRIRIPKQQGETFLDLRSDFVNGKDVSRVKYFLPQNTFSKNVGSWLDQAFVTGSITQGGAIFYGNINDYPFFDNEGVFEVLYELKGGELSYAENWPHVSEIDADILFYQNSLRVDFKHARVSGATVTNAVGTIASLKNSKHGWLKGQVTGSIAQSLDFLQQTPLHSTVAPIIKTISAHGSNAIDVKIKVPLRKDIVAKVDGVAHLHQAQLNVLPLDLPVEKIKGDLVFTEKGLSCQDISAQALGYPVTVSIQNDTLETSVHVVGNTDVANLSKQFASPWWKIAQGNFEYKLGLHIPHDRRNEAKLFVNSSLAGLNIDLPAPLGKDTAEENRLNLQFTIGDMPLLPLDMSYGEQLYAAISIDKQRRALYSGHIVFGTGQADFLANPGVKLDVRRETFDLKAWQALGGNEQENVRESIMSLSDISIETPHLLYGEDDYGAIALNLTLSDKQWQGVIDTDYMQGKLHIPNNFAADTPIRMDLTRLNLSRFEGVKKSGGSISPLDFPLLEINSGKVFWRSVNLGALRLKSKRVSDGMIFNRFELYSANSRLSLPGSSWKVIGEQTVSDATGTLEADNLGYLLSRLQLNDEMRETEASIDISLQWPGAPQQFSLPVLRGRVALDLVDGRLLGVEPGIGRILGILDLGQLERRLQFDFRDLYSKGLSYDRIKGAFSLEAGIAEIDNLLVQAVAAKISIVGRTNLVAQEYDLIATVIPKSSAAIPIAGTIMQGITRFFVKSLTGERKDGLFFKSQFAIRGAWGDAVIIPLHKNDGLLQKAWTGLTDFPWVDNQRNNKRD